MREDWEICTISEVSEVLNGDRGKNYPSRAHYVQSGMPFVSAGNIGDNKKLRNELNFITEEKFELLRAGKLQRNDIVYCIRGSIGKFAIIDFDQGAIASSLCIVRTNETVDRNYFCYYLESPLCRLEINKFDNGTAQPNLSAKDFKRLELPLSSKSEQRAIVSKIEELFSDLDKGVADLKKAQDQLKVYRQAVLKKAFEGELTKGWREQQTDLPHAEELLDQIKEERLKHYELKIENWKQAVDEWEENGKKGKKPSKPKHLKDPEKIEDGEIESYNNLPDSWLWSRLANTVVDHSSDIVDGPFGSNLKSTEYQDEGKPILRIQNIKSNKFIDKNIKYVSNEKYNFLKRHQFKPNDVIVTKLGDPLGLACRVPLDFMGGVIVADLIRIRPSSSYINYDWLTLLINSIVIQSQFRKITKGTTRPRMNLTIMRNTIVPLPSYEEQHQIIQEIESRLSVCDKVEESITESLEKAEALRQSILRKAFEGRLLSTQEIDECKAAPDYEPAAVLLEKIKMKQ